MKTNNIGTINFITIMAALFVTAAGLFGIISQNRYASEQMQFWIVLMFCGLLTMVPVLYEKLRVVLIMLWLILTVGGAVWMSGGIGQFEAPALSWYHYSVIAVTIVMAFNVVIFTMRGGK